VPPVERVFVGLVPEPTPLYADVLQALVFLRERRAAWVQERRRKADFYHKQLEDLLRV